MDCFACLAPCMPSAKRPSGVVALVDGVRGAMHAYLSVHVNQQAKGVRTRPACHAMSSQCQRHSCFCSFLPVLNVKARNKVICFHSFM